MSMAFLPGFGKPGCWPGSDALARRLDLIRAAALLCLARLVIVCVPFRRWRGRLGLSGERGDEIALHRAMRLARRVDRAADWLPFPSKCLPRAMALSWLLRRERIPHALVLAIRPPDQRDDGDSLHAWIECADRTILGDLPGPWHQIHRAAAPIPAE